MLLFSCMHVEKKSKIILVFYCCVFLVRRSHKTARNRCCVTTLIMFLKVKSRRSRKIYIQGVPKKKKDILNIHIKSEGINIFSQKFC